MLALGLAIGGAALTLVSVLDRRIYTAADVRGIEGLTVIATLHHVEYARRYADRVLGLRGGRLVFDGPAAELDDGAVGRIFGVERPDAPEAVAPPLAVAEWAAR